jgi:hypothetical protein
MKLLFVLFPMTLFSFINGCNKEKMPDDLDIDIKDTSSSFMVKVEASFCAYTILSVQDSAFYNKGMKWKDYDHVFSVSNPCDRPADLKTGELYKCIIIDKPKKTDCIVCMGFMETPPLERNVLLFR